MSSGLAWRGSAAGFTRLARFAATFLFLLCCPLPADAQWRPVGEVSRVTILPQGVELAAAQARVRVTAVSPAVLRVRYAPQGAFPPEHSFAVLRQAFPPAPRVEALDRADKVEFQAGEVGVEIQKSPLRISFLDASGGVVLEDHPRYPVSFNGNAFRVWKSMPEDEHYFGLGDKTGPLDRRDLAFSMWNMDAFGWQESTDPLYKSIPFFVALRNGAAYGLFLDNTYRSSFDFGKESRDAYSFGSDGGELDYYFFYGPDPKRVIADFTALVGRTPLPPLFALGYQQCRYSYYPESQVRELAHKFREDKIPADVIYLDIDYQQANRPFTVDHDRFPHFEGMVKDLHDQGFKIVAITDLHLAKLPGYRPYDEGMAANYLVHNPDGSVYVGRVWPGDSVFPDFTREVVRKWWGTLYADFVKMGVRGFWNDMNEPAVFRYPSKTMPINTVHNVEGRKTDHREIHNVFGMENARATYEGLLRLQPDVRPFVLTRAAFAGAERYAATWTGDNSATWNHMRISIPQLINLGLSGYAFVGDDIGGFNGSPTPELLTRWMELGAFNPIYRNHAAKATRYREPWVDGPEHEAIRKRYIEARYRLLPYIYTSMEETSRTGIPLMRPMFLEFPKEPELTLNANQFMFGSSLLVAPKVWEFATAYDVALPKGDWYNYWTGEKLTGGKAIQIDPPLDTLPVYVRAGSILAQSPVVQHVEEMPQGPLEVRVYPGPECRGDLYMDDGNTLAYQRGQFLRAHFTCEVAPDHLAVNMSAPEGPYRPWFKEVQIVVYGVDRKLRGLTVDGESVTTWNTEGSRLTLSPLSWSGTAHNLRLEYVER
jgi:alpha-glucosidase